VMMAANASQRRDSCMRMTPHSIGTKSSVPS
jgi:hypothetical protein